MVERNLAKVEVARSNRVTRSSCWKTSWLLAPQPLERHMFVWSKQSAAKGADAWEERFRGLPGVHPVITAIPGKPSIRVEVYCERRNDANAILKTYGGSIRALKKQNWAAMSPPPPDPIRVRDRLVIIGQRGKAELAKAKKKFPGREILSVPPDNATTVLRMPGIIGSAGSNTRTDSEQRPPPFLPWPNSKKMLPPAARPSPAYASCREKK